MITTANKPIKICKYLSKKWLPDPQGHLILTIVVSGSEDKRVRIWQSTLRGVSCCTGRRTKWQLDSKVVLSSVSSAGTSRCTYRDAPELARGTVNIYTDPTTSKLTHSQVQSRGQQEERGSFAKSRIRQHIREINDSLYTPVGVFGPRCTPRSTARGGNIRTFR